MIRYLSSFLLFILVSVFWLNSTAQDMDVGIYYGSSPKSAWIKIETGTYILYGDQKQLTMVDTGESIFISWSGSKASIKNNGDTYEGISAIHLIARNFQSEFRIKPLSDDLAEHIYPGSLKWVYKNGKTLAINRVNIEDYTAGVVESESGKEQNLEFYKVQAIICRTYALSNIRRHEDEGFELCDQVHCQVYHGKARFNKDIPKAANETHGYVLVDSDINLVTAAFHSNCGGHTMNSEHVWSKPLPYLVGRPDTFCLTMPHALWEKEIKQSEWESYLRKKSAMDSADANKKNWILPDYRLGNFEDEDSKIPMKTIRHDWELPSAYFNIQEKEDKLCLTGRGFGHGVGLCQEGAMRMSQLDYSYQEILHYYYTSVHLVKLSALDFFRDEKDDGLED